MSDSLNATFNSIFPNETLSAVFNNPFSAAGIRTLSEKPAITALYGYKFLDAVAGYESIIQLQNGTVLLLGEAHWKQNPLTTSTFIHESFYYPFAYVIAEVDTIRNKISFRQAKELAIKALFNAEERRKVERNKESKYWEDLEIEE